MKENNPLYRLTFLEESSLIDYSYMPSPLEHSLPDPVEFHEFYY